MHYCYIIVYTERTLLQKTASGKSLLAQSTKQGMQMSESQIWIDTCNCITFNPKERNVEKGLQFKHVSSSWEEMQNPNWGPIME